MKTFYIIRHNNSNNCYNVRDSWVDKLEEATTFSTPAAALAAVQKMSVDVRFSIPVRIVRVEETLAVTETVVA